jgi:16S rRNA (guanine1207-N2)-methyltransferase
MSRWAEDREAAADELIVRSLDDVDLTGRVLLANQGGTLPSLLGKRAIAFEIWNRRLVEGATAAVWPPPGPFDAALVRLPKAKEELLMTAHAVLSVLRPGRRLVLYGGNDEGIRSAGDSLSELCGSVDVLAARGHGRVLAADRPEKLAGLRTSLAAWRTLSRLPIAGVARDWVTYPGLFAAGRVDEGTALLLGALPPLAAGARVLDYGCGAGVIGAAVLAREAGLLVDMLDNDTVALEAARENVPAGRPILASRLIEGDYDAILSNPPLHRGIARDEAYLRRLIADAPDRLRPGGLLQMVVQRQVALDRLLGEHFGAAEVVALDGRYRVWRARRA